MTTHPKPVAQCTVCFELLEKLSVAAAEYVSSAGNLCVLAESGDHAAFRETERMVRQSKDRCTNARISLEAHRSEHQ